ncbi:MAG: hypothetical protein PVJ32_05920, partial [Anaerolineales bacterium]
MIRKPDGRTQLSLNQLVPIGLALFLGASIHLPGRPLAAGSISIHPDSGPAGISVTVTGGGFAPSTMGMIYWEEIPVMTEPPMGSFSTDASGDFLSPVTIMIPSDAAEGGHVIYACTHCTSPEQRIIGSDVYWVMAPVQPTVVPTPTDVPTICDPSGVEGETVIHFDDLVAGATLFNQPIGEIATFRHANPQTISTPLAHSGNIAVINHDTESGYASVLEIELSVVQDFVGVFVGVEGAEGHSFTATLIAWSSLQGGTPIPVASNTVELGPDRQRIEECLAVEAPGQITSITLEYGPRGEVDQPEFIDDLILRGPEDPPPVSPDLSPPIVDLFSPEDGIAYFSEHVLVEGEVREAGFMPRVELILDGQAIRTLEINRVASGHYRFHYMLGSEETVACGPHALTIKAIDEERLEGYATADFSFFGAGDLSILSNEAVQVLYNAPLVRDKNTAFRITYLSTFACELEASFQLLLAEDEWNTDFSSTDYPEIWGPVSVSPGPDPQTIMLPYIEPGRANADFDPGFNPAGILRGGQTPSGLTPDRRAAPRPIAETVSATVVIDPEDQIVETNEMNNGLHSNWSPTIATRPWNILFIPTHVAADNCSPQINGMQAPLQLQLEYLLAAFPIADDKLSFGIMPAQVSGSCPQGACDWSITAPDAGDGRGQMLADASRLALMSGYDFGVAVTCGGGGAILGHSTSVFVGRDAGLVTMAHEFNHAVTGMEDIYSLDCFAMWDEAYCELADGSRTYCCQEDGYLIEDGHTGDNCWMDPVSGEPACSVQTKTCAQSCQCSVYRRDAEPNVCLEVDGSGQYVMPECDVGCCWNVCAANCQNGVVYSSPDG